MHLPYAKKQSTVLSSLSKSLVNNDKWYVANLHWHTKKKENPNYHILSRTRIPTNLSNYIYSSCIYIHSMQLIQNLNHRLDAFLSFLLQCTRQTSSRVESDLERTKTSRSQASRFCFNYGTDRITDLWSGFINSKAISPLIKINNHQQAGVSARR